MFIFIFKSQISDFRSVRPPNSDLQIPPLSLPLDRGRWFRADVITNAVDPGNLVNNSCRHSSEHFVRQSRPVGGHEVIGFDAADYQCVLVGSRVTHHANALNRQQNSKQLRRLAVKPRPVDFINHNRVGFAKNLQTQLGNLSQATNGKPWAREGMSPYDRVGQPQLQPQLANLRP